MKKVLLSAFALATFATAANAQTIIAESFNSQAVGSLAPDATGTAPGATGFYTEGNDPYDFYVMPLDPAYGNSVMVLNGAGAASTDTRYAYKEITATPAAGNTIIKGTVDINTGNRTGNAIAHFSVYNWTSDGLKLLTGAGYNANALTTTGNLIGMGRFTANATNVTSNYNITLGTTQIPSNTWIRMGFTYNPATGETRWATPAGTYVSTSITTLTSLPNIGAATDLFIISTPGTGNSASTDIYFDNLNVEYSNNTTLNLEETPIKATGVMVYPNPTSDVVKITAKSKVDAVEIFDLSGKKIAAEVKNNEVDVRSYAPGTYLINVITKDGKTMTKFIKN